MKDLLKLHLQLENDYRINSRKKDNYSSTYGKLNCEVCGFDPIDIYGRLGAKNLVECHHVGALNELDPGDELKIEDLVLVCSNCHRILHQEIETLTVSSLKAQVKGNLCWDFILEKKSFFNHFFSTFHPFTELELSQLYKKLKRGYTFSSPSIDSEPLGVGQAMYGLTYNKNVVWTPKIRELYSSEEDFFLAIENFNDLPHDIRSQVEYHQFFEEEQFRYHSSDGQPVHPYLTEKYNRIFNKLTFSGKEILEIIHDHSLDHFCNECFVYELDSMIKMNVPDLNIIKFYEHIDEGYWN